MASVRVYAAIVLTVACADGQQLPLPKPGPEITRLAQAFLGSWKTSERHERSALIPAGGAGKGTQTFRKGPGGLVLIFENQSRNPAFQFSGHGVLAWDDREKVYKSYWFDATNPSGEIQVGRWEGNELIFQGRSEVGGKRVNFRSVYTNFRPNSFTYYTEAETDNEPMKRVMTIDYIRSEKGR